MQFRMKHNRVYKNITVLVNIVKKIYCDLQY